MDDGPSYYPCLQIIATLSDRIDAVRRNNGAFSQGTGTGAFSDAGTRGFTPDCIIERGRMVKAGDTDC